jgi:hypothetical protein
MGKKNGALLSVRAELSSADLGDARLERRLVKVGERLAKSPALSFPKVATTPSELEAFYRFFGNERVTWDRILAPHVEATTARCAEHASVLVVHDTTEFTFSTDDAREDIGYLSRGARGFGGHVALAVAEDEWATPLGVTGLVPQVRSEIAPKVSRAEATRRSINRPRAEKENYRWKTLLDEAAKRLEGHPNVIHVMDREADGYDLLADIVHAKQRFVIRSSHDRSLAGGPTLSGTLAEMEAELIREVPLTKVKRNQKNPKSKMRRSRAARLAKLKVKAGSVEIKRPKHSQSDHATTRLNVVQVFEVDAPEGEAPIEWMLLTSETIETSAQIERVIDIYRRRWVIEEYFKALKTGCSYEKRQLMSLHALLNALAVLIPIAWRLLLLRNIGRENPTADGKTLVTKDELLLLRALSVRVKLDEKPNAEAVMLAIAGLGGHLKQNGSPGWQTLWAGCEKLQSAMIGWRALKKLEK